ncbi:MAG TPA: alpha/beta fold hydrolase [Acidobacteriaceae bacterium]|nr:alpha/beta fold hydrolase [Acidobacteriaceae bacterium]
MPPSKSSKPKQQKAPQRASARAAAEPRTQPPSAFEKAFHEMRHQPGAFPNISATWLLKAFAFTLVAIAGFTWLALCLIYWQGSWQLLYHPKAAISRTPASSGLAYEPVHFADVTETGTTQLTGWWIPANASLYTVLYLHGSDGNLSDTVDTLAALHNAGLAVFAIDYRGYGQSQTGHPSEKRLRQDAEWALNWLTGMRQIPAKNLVVYGTGLGANLAAELAASHNEIAGVVLDQPVQNPVQTVFSDPRSRLVPAHWLVQDRYDLAAAAASLQTPSLWLLAKPDPAQPAPLPADYKAVPGKKSSAWMESPATADTHFTETLHRWLDDLR